MKLNNFKRLIVEEFPQETQPTVEKLSFALNPFLEQVVNAFNKNIDFDNLNQEVIEFTVTVDANGRPTTQTELRSSLRTKVRGYIVIRAQSEDPNGPLPLSTPLISFSQNESGVRITGVTGLPANNKFRLTVISIG
jgi:hypothetical protein